MNIVEQKRTELIELCENHNVKELYLFGSILTDRFSAKSDIDMLIQFSVLDLSTYFDNYMDLKEKLEFLFQRPIDLVENQSIKNPIFRKVIDREKKLVYERTSA
jgi:predicted nucleotidyltransferase